MTERFEQPILVIVDHVGDEEAGFSLTPASEHLLKVAHALTNDEVVAVALNAAPHLGALGACGTSKVVVPDLAGRSPRVSAVVADAVAAAANSLAVPVAAILCVSNYRGREVASMLAAHFGSGAACDVTDLRIEGGRLIAQKNVLAGQWDTTFTIPSGLPIVALRPGSGQAVEPEEVRTPGIIPVRLDFSSPADAVRVVSSQMQEETGPDLTQARVVVCAGYGTGGEVELVTQLAQQLDGAVGATRAVCDEGWIERSRQIGQTGVSVAPKVYIGVGVSGAIHHTCGISGAEKIVAVVDDPDAPLVEMADFSVIGDYEPILSSALQQLQQS